MAALRLLCLPLLALALLGLAPVRPARATPPPDTLALVYPAAPVPLGQDVLLGFSDANSSVVPALVRSVAVSLTWPNGTSAPVLSFMDSLGEGLGDGALGVVFTPDQVGSYTAYWNVTYLLYPSVSSSIPYLTQSWVLSGAFSVVHDAGLPHTATFALAPVQTVVATFASPPGGDVSYASTGTLVLPPPSASASVSAARQAWGGCGGMWWAGAAAVFAGLAGAVLVLGA